MALAGFLDSICARLVLPMIVAPAEHQPFLGPDDLRAKTEAAGFEAIDHLAHMQRAVPDIGDIAWKQRPP